MISTFICAQARGIELGLPLDDAWIHAAFARNVAQQGTWGLFYGIGSGGESSFLWPLLLSIGEFGKGGLAAQLGLALGGFSFLALPGAVGSLAGGTRRGIATAIAVGICGPLLFTALSGMETIPALLCGTLAIGQVGRGNMGRAGICAGLAAMLRPDGVLLIAVLVCASLIRGWRIGPRDLRKLATYVTRLWPAIALAVVAIGGLALFEQRFPPTTMGGRRWLVGMTQTFDLTAIPNGFSILLKDWAATLTTDLGAGRLLMDTPVHGPFSFAWRIMSLLAVGLGAWSYVRSSRVGNAPESLLVLVWTAVVLAFYVAILPDRGHGGRYQPQVYIALIILCVEGIAFLHGRLTGLRFAPAVLIMFLSAPLVAHAGEAAILWGNAVRGINRVHVKTAKELVENLPERSVVAVFDVGATAYFHAGPMVDLSGLTSRKIVDHLYQESVLPILEARGATHLLLPVFMITPEPDALAQRLGIAELTQVEDAVVLENHVGYEGWIKAFMFSGNAFRYVVLYEIRG